MAKGKKNRVLAALEVALVTVIANVIRYMPYRMTQSFGAGLAEFIHNVIGIRKKHAISELLKAYPDKDEAWAANITKKVYRHFGMVAVEMAMTPQLVKTNFKNRLMMDDCCLKLLDEGLEHGKGMLIVSGHLGNWEMSGAAAAHNGYPVNYIVGNQSNSAIEEIMDKYRRMSGIKIIKKLDAGRAMLKVLRSNEACAVMIDQDARKHGIFVPFFGRPASTPLGVARFACKLDSTVLMMHTWRDEKNIIHVKLEKVEVPNSGDKDQDIYDLTANMTKMLEGYIRQNPDQWLWLHRRWKTAPPENGVQYTKSNK